MKEDMNNMSLERAEKFLGELGIKAERDGMALRVSRDSMANWPVDPNDLLSELKAECRAAKFFWGGRDDEWLWLESF